MQDKARAARRRGTPAGPRRGQSLRWVPKASICAGSFGLRWRRKPDRTAEALAASMRANGQAQPMVVLDLEDGTFELIAGHPCFGHVYRPWQRFRDQAARLAAEEITTTEYVPEPLPEEAIILADYPWLPAGESTDHRYVRLLRWGSFEVRRVPGEYPRDGSTGGGS